MPLPELPRAVQKRLPHETQLQTILEIQSPVQRRQATQVLLGSLNSEQLVQLISTSSKFEVHPKLLAMQVQLFEVLVGIDPEKALQQVWRMPRRQQQDYIRVVFRQWARVDMLTALSRAQAIEPPNRSLAIQALTSECADLVPMMDGDILEFAQDNDFEDLAQSCINEAKVLRLAQQPALALEMAASLPLNKQSQLGLLTRLFRTWIRTDGVEGVLPLLSIVHDAFRDYSSFVETLIKDIASHNPESAWKYVLEHPSEMQQETMRAVLTAWSEIEPEQVLHALSDLEYVDRLSSSYHQLIYVWGRNRPAELLDNVGRFPQIHKDSAITMAVGQLARSGSIDAAKQYLEEMKSRDAMIDHAAREFITVWAQVDPVAATNWALEFGAKEQNLRASLLRHTLPQLAAVDAMEAMKKAKMHAYDESNVFVTPDTWVIEGLAANGDLESSLAMLEEVREPMRLGSYVAIGLAFVEFGQPDEAITLTQQLSAAEQEDYFKRITGTWFSTNPDHLIDSFKHLPNDGARRVVAETTLEFDQSLSYLTTEQFKYVRTFLGLAEVD